MNNQFDDEGFAKEKEEMRFLIQDLRLRLRKLKDNPVTEQKSGLLDKIHSDLDRLSKMARVIGGQVLLDYSNLHTDIGQFLNVPEDKTAFPQVEADVEILLNELKGL